ncbi:replication-associated recombination protein A [Persephonella sp. KM09-Lau-8]|uniref:replication-associated recombination protein A n=1 Tax=Persephonella sp. KM09-Lau-8 TaxID=1158345 RepID=UPI000495FD45|nr:replication-associated recombination protein A [Persephonella sp. KM09-Lau-8]
MNKKPLSERLRPERLSQIIGQEELLGEGKPLRQIIKSGNLKSMILWGPPGTGKTTLARVIAKETNYQFFELNAISSGVQDIRKVIEESKKNPLFSNGTILFIDEIHRFNKGQQEALLSAVEKGEIILIGATTENPSFSLVSPLLSRCHVFQLKPLSYEALEKLIDRALKEDKILSKRNIQIPDKEMLINLSGGDARVLLNAIEMAVNITEKDPVIIDKDLVKQVFSRPNLIYDRNQDIHYSLISAFIKSIRGSDPDAAVYYLAKMLEGGEDPVFIARRLVILASEDVGNAEPYALTLATSCLTAVEKIGMPEAQIILSQTATYLASCPKSNAAYKAIKEAIKDVRQNPNIPVLLHLINPSTKLMEKLGYGKNYKYPHDYPENFVVQNYLPPELKNKQYYLPTENGREKKIKERLKNLWKGIKKYI